MTVYVDASVLVALHVSEVHSDAALQWLDRNIAADLAYSARTHVECASAFAKKVRAQALTASQRADAEGRLLGMQKLMRSLPVLSVHFTRAAELVSHYQTGLRSGDALHLAIAEHHGATIATFDTVLGAAAAYFGVPVAAIS